VAAFYMGRTALACCRAVVRSSAPGRVNLTLAGARAVQAPVLGTRPARLRDSFLQGLPRPEYPHGSVARGQPGLLRVRVDRRAMHVDRLERPGVFGLERLRKTRDARAYSIVSGRPC